MAFDRDIIRNKVLSLDGNLVFLGAYQFGLTFSRAGLPHSCLAEIGQFKDKGDWDGGATFQGYGVAAMKKLGALLASDTEPNSLLYLPRGDTRLSPFAAVGDPAIFYRPKTEENPRTVTKGKIVEFTAKLSLADGAEPCFGQVVTCTLAKTPAPWAAGVHQAGTQIVLGDIHNRDDAAIPRVGATVGVFTVHVTRIDGTGRVTVLAEGRSDTSGNLFASPTTQWTMPLFVSSAPSGTDVLGPASQTIVIDGEVSPIPNETDWTIRFTVTDAGSDGRVEVIAAAALYKK